MEEILEQLKVYVFTYGPSLIVATAILLIGFWVAKLISNRIRSAMEISKVETSTIDLVAKVSFYGFLILVLIAVADQLGFDTTFFLKFLGGYAYSYIPRIASAIAIFFIGKWLANKLSVLISLALKRSKADESIISFVESISYYCLLIIVLVAVAGQLGINTTSFLTILGAAGLAIGLALKDSLSNFSSGIMIVIFKPFKLGDVVDVGGTVGKVTEITIFSTILTSGDNQKFIVPNSSVMGTTIKNITANPTRRIDMIVGIGYDDDIKKAKEILTRLTQEDERILTDPEPTIAVGELADSSINFVFRPWVKTEDYWVVKFDLTEKIKLIFDEEGISIPFPQRDIHLYENKAG